MDREEHQAPVPSAGWLFVFDGRDASGQVLDDGIVVLEFARWTRTEMSEKGAAPLSGSSRLLVYSEAGYDARMTEKIGIDAPESHLEGLDEQFMDGTKRLANGDIDAAAEVFRRILTAEPRLAEPRIELARILIETSQLKEAEAEVREPFVSLRTAASGWMASQRIGCFPSLTASLRRC